MESDGMMMSVGVDIIEIDRIKHAIEKRGERFLKRIYSDREIAYCSSKVNPYPSYAVRFAAKESYIKAKGGLHGKCLAQIEVSRQENGQPYFIVNGKRERRLHLSLSHCHAYAVAIASPGRLL
ncbi:holo-ACP synthase [Candidatus Mcinerneyibacteriota bacterium]|nr:holo-ACP synthase [Candidatus Mcinerneyibacteriota bacterium]